MFVIPKDGSSATAGDTAALRFTPTGMLTEGLHRLAVDNLTPASQRTALFLYVVMSVVIQ
jgi:hypothetical protein